MSETDASSKPPARDPGLYNAGFILVLVFAAAVRVLFADVPYHRNAEGVASFYGQLARNYFRHSWTETMAVPVQSMGRAPNVEPVFYSHHPPAVPLLIAATYAVFDHPDQADFVPEEWQTRLPSAVFAVLCVAAMYLIVRKLANPRLALLAAFLLATTPMVLLFGGHADVINAQLVFFALLTVAVYIRFHRAPSMRWFGLLCLCFLPAGMTDWPAYFLVPVLFFHFLWTRPRSKWLWIIGFGAFATTVFLAMYVQIVLVKHDWGWITQLVRKRSIDAVTDDAKAFTWIEWLRTVVGHNIRQHTIPLLLVSLAWIALYSWRPATKRAKPILRFTRLLLAWALLHIVVGRQGVYEHDWWWWPLTPGLVLGAALMIERFCLWLEERHVTGWKLAPLVIVPLLAFGTWTTLRTRGEFVDPSYMGDPNYSIVEMGDAIRKAAPANTLVLLAENDEGTLPLWYYADRPLIRNVWDRYTLENLLANPQYAELPFNLREPWPYPAAGFVFPKAYISPKLDDFLTYLRQNFQYIEDEKFFRFDLTRRTH